jgi:hypothetical protein
MNKTIGTVAIATIVVCAIALTSFSASAATWKGVDVGDAKYIYGGHKTAMILSEDLKGCFLGGRSFGTIKAFFFMSGGHVKKGCAADRDGEPVLVFPVLDDEPDGELVLVPFPQGFRKFETRKFETI